MSSNMKSMQILLATFNSGKYLRDQLDSLFAQDYQEFQLLIRDGGSQDDTLGIIRSYQKEYADRICFLGSRKATALENFSELLNAADSDLVMFCDHDDVWLPHKVSCTLKRYLEMENLYGNATPLMTFTDSMVTDTDLKIISNSMLRYQNLYTDHLTLNRLILQNVPSGNTMLINRALVELARPIPKDAVMHDHWISLVAASFGEIGFENQATLYYRQHGENVYGATQYSLKATIQKIRGGRKKIVEKFEKNISQAVAFGRIYGKQLSSLDREMLTELAHWNEFGVINKIKCLIKYRILKCGFWRIVGTFLLLLSWHTYRLKNESR